MRTTVFFVIALLAIANATKEVNVFA